MEFPVLTLVLTLLAMVVPMVGIYWFVKRREKEATSLEDILKTDSTLAPKSQDEDDELEAIKAEAWPTELPGLDAIDAYEDLKEKLLAHFGEDEDVTSSMLAPEARTKLRHGLMDRCQGHVAWLLRLEREQRSMERMSRRGMISAADYALFSTFAEKLDVEVSEVRDEAAWLCDDDARSRQAADEIWRIAVQIWQQRRNAAASRENNAAPPREATTKAESEKLREKEKTESLKAKVRAAQAKKSLKGLKGGFLDAGGAGGGATGGAATTSKSKNGTTSTTAAGGNGTSSKKKQSSSASAAPSPPETNAAAKETFQATQWPERLPNVRQKETYEKLKKQALEEEEEEASSSPAAAAAASHETTTTTNSPVLLRESEEKQRLRQALMERCQALVPLLKALDVEQERYRQAIEKARWASGVGAPKAEDWGKLERISQLADEEKKLVEDEADWLGDKEGTRGFGEKIWPMAFQVYQQLRSETEKQQRAVTEKVLGAYAQRRAKPWPKVLPGAKHRDEYERLKATSLAALPPAARAAVLQGKPAPFVLGAQSARQLRQALMNRCQHSVPLIQRLQQEAKAVQIAADRGLVDDAEIDAFQHIEHALKLEVDAVKQEAEWLTDDSGTRKGMGDQIWQAAFQIYAKRRADIAKNLALAQQKSASSEELPQPQPSDDNAADIID